MNSKRPAPAEAELIPDRLPRHVAIIMDGNGRWAKKRLLNRVKGHEKGVETVREIVRASREIGIECLTLYAFSTENWKRPQSEITTLMGILDRFLKTEKDEMLENNIHLSTIGQTNRLPDFVRRTLQETLSATADNNGMVLNLALSYGARAEICQMAAKIAQMVRDGRIHPQEITEETVAAHLETAGMADPDLLIRTGGEMRISNFLLWQIAYAEIAITDTLWPDFTRAEYVNILSAYQRRERRFGAVV